MCNVKVSEKLKKAQINTTVNTFSQCLRLVNIKGINIAASFSLDYMSTSKIISWRINLLQPKSRRDLSDILSKSFPTCSLTTASIVVRSYSAKPKKVDKKRKRASYSWFQDSCFDKCYAGASIVRVVHVDSSPLRDSAIDKVFKILPGLSLTLRWLNNVNGNCCTNNDSICNIFLISR